MNLSSLTKEQQLILLGLVVSIVVGLGVMAYRHFSEKPAGEIVIERLKGDEQAPQRIGVVVHISGAVKREGVYKLNPGDRLLDALKIAGGALPLADLSAINLAEPVKDGEKIIVPVKRKEREEISGDPAFAGASASRQDIRGSGTSSQKVNLNIADEKALDALPGVGPATAKAIVEYRRTNGPFTRIEQIMEIPRFGKAKFERVKDRITI